MTTKNTTEEVKKMLLQGRRITKLDLFYESEINSSCLPQRIYDIRQTTDWDIKSQSKKGKGTLREYWLEPEEIERIKTGKPRNEQYIKEETKVAEMPLNKPKNKNFEQMGLGIPGTDSLHEWW